MTLIGFRKLFLACAVAGLTACGSDSTGPGPVGPDAALQSLALGLNSGGLPFALGPSTLGTAAHGIDQIDVSINGTTHSMYALGLRMTYPEGTCVENLFVIPTVTLPEPSCTPPPLGLVLVLWQTTSGQRPPKRMAFISGDIGTVDFSFLPTETAPVFSAFPSFAIYVNDREEFWTSRSGSLTSAVTVGSETCDVPAPPFAATSTCNFATFDEQGQITLERFDFSLFEPASQQRATMDLVIPRQNVRGIVQAITQITPVTIPGDWDY